MPTIQEVTGQYQAAVNRASDLARQGLISPEEYGTMLNKFRRLLEAHTVFDIDQPPVQPPEQTVPTPMPRPDPRGSTWRDRLPRQIGEENARLQGFNPSRNDFSIDPAMNEMQRGYLPAPGRTLPDNPNSMLYGKPPEQGS